MAVHRVPARLHVLLAREAPVGVVIRRGPSEQTRLILWHTRHDAFTPGQWLKHRVYERRCDLSPDGTKLVYFVLDGHWDGPTGFTYTAVSHPPYFTALALWPNGDVWHGGGLFKDNATVWINGGGPPMPAEPAGLRVIQRCPYPTSSNMEDLEVYFPRLQRDGWARTGDSSGETRYVVTWEKASRRVRLIKRVVTSLTRIDRRPGQGVYFDEHDAVDERSGAAFPLPDAEWADFDHRGRLVYASGGKLWHADIAAGELRTVELADFNEMSFEPVPGPDWARRW